MGLRNTKAGQLYQPMVVLHRPLRVDPLLGRKHQPNKNPKKPLGNAHRGHVRRDLKKLFGRPSQKGSPVKLDPVYQPREQPSNFYVERVKALKVPQ